MRAERATTRYLGAALFPQAGVALGMALLAANQLPLYAETILTVALTATILLEVSAPIATRWALRRAEGQEG